MADVNITYKGASIATMDASGTKTLTTQGKYCEGDISVAYTKPSGKETLSWHQCPEAVRSYLAAAQAAYPTASDDYSCVHEYAPQGSNVSDEVSRATSKPLGYTVDGVTFYNNEPLVETPFATANKAGSLTALDRLRWINSTLASPAEGSMYSRGWNCRDLGGWACDGGTIKYGMLVRGSEPNPVDKDMMVNQIGIKTEVQLLPRKEQPTNYKEKSPWGIDWAGNDTEDVTVYSPADVSDPAKKALWAKILKAIINSVNHAKPVYFHCGIGADRTGVTAMVLEGILGVSRSDTDIDFELTDFAIGWKYINLPSYGGDFVYRARNYPVFKDLKQSFDDIPLARGLTDTFRNHCVSFALSLGITIDEINAFRSAMIDGTPDVITIIVPTYTISKSGSHVAYDNDTASVNENSSYSVGVIPASGYVISDVSVTMGGTDITSQVFSGTPTVRRVSVTNNLSNCSTSNASSVVEAGTAYTATITADEGYTLDGATVSITMGGTNVSQYYSNGTISIQTVTGDVVINVAAVESARENLFDISGTNLNSRIASTGDLRTGANGRVVCNMIDITNLSALEIEGVTQVADPNNWYVRLGLYTNATLAAASFVTETDFSSATYAIDVAALKTANPTATHIAIQICISSAAITAADLANLAIYGS